jgi:hypothetical protein
MHRRLLWVGPPLLAAGILLFALLGHLPAQDARPGSGAGDRAELDRKVAASLRDVIERGRHLYNGERDYTGCYRIFEGGLLAVMPLLDHRPELQKEIYAGLAQAERISVAWQQAFALRKVIDNVRSQLRTPVGPPVTDKVPADSVKDVKPEPDTIKKGPLDKDKVILDRKVEDKVKPADKGSLDKDKPLPDRKVEDKLPPDKVRPDQKATDKPDLDKRPPADAGKVPLDKDKVILDKKVEDKVKPADKGSLDKDKVIVDRKIEDKRPLDKLDVDKKPTDRKVEDKKIETDKKKEEKEPPADQASVKGQVLFQGKPLTSGFVTFVDPDGRKYSASIKVDGSYAFKGVTLPPGEYRVFIENSVSLGKGQPRGAEVPQRFQSAETSGLTANLQRGQNAFDLNLR